MLKVISLQHIKFHNTYVFYYDIKGGEERLDASVTFDDATHESVVFAHPHEDYDHDKWFSAYTPQAEDGCYIGDQPVKSVDGKPDVVCWWHMVSCCDELLLAVEYTNYLEYILLGLWQSARCSQRHHVRV